MPIRSCSSAADATDPFLAFRRCYRSVPGVPPMLPFRFAVPPIIPMFLSFRSRCRSAPAVPLMVSSQSYLSDDAAFSFLALCCCCLPVSAVPLIQPLRSWRSADAASRSYRSAAPLIGPVGPWGTGGGGRRRPTPRSIPAAAARLARINSHPVTQCRLPGRRRTAPGHPGRRSCTLHRLSTDHNSIASSVNSKLSDYKFLALC